MDNHFGYVDNTEGNFVKGMERYVFGNLQARYVISQVLLLRQVLIVNCYVKDL